MRYQEWLYVPNVGCLRHWILEKAHGSRYLIHPGFTNMYHDLKEIFLLDGLKKDKEKFFEKFPNCQQVKAEHQKSDGLLQQIQVPTWKWEDINMDFIVGLPQT